MKLRKKIISMILAAGTFILCWPLSSVLAASSSLSGPSSVKAGDTISITYSVQQSKMQGADAKISWDSNQLSVSSVSKGSGWNIDTNQSGSSLKIVAYGSATNSSKTLVTVKFKVKSLSEGTTVKISASATLSDGNSEFSTSSSYSKKIASSGSSSDPPKTQTSTNSNTAAAKKSSDNKLKSLSISNASISPKFSSGTESYTTSVPFEVSKLDIKASANHSKAKVSISNNSLKDGKTTAVTIEVKAENGSVRKYTINASRERDPNYVPSSNNFLSSLTASSGTLSPAFSKETTRYRIIVPADVSSLTLTPVPEDEYASAAEVSADLGTGENVLRITCTAEDGKQLEYLVAVKREAALNSFSDSSRQEELFRQIADSGTKHIYTEAASILLSRELLDRLKANEGKNLIISSEKGSLTVSSDNIKEAAEEVYDLSFIFSSVYSDKLKEKLDSGTYMLFSTVYEGTLFGSVTFTVQTGFDSSVPLYVYEYEPVSGAFYTAAQKIYAQDGGFLSFEYDRASTFVITDKEIETAAESAFLKMKAKINVSEIVSMFRKNPLIPAVLAVLILLFGFISGMAIGRKRSVKRLSAEIAAAYEEEAAVVYEETETYNKPDIISSDSGMSISE